MFTVKPHFVSPQRGVGGSPRKSREEKSPNKELVNCKCGVAEEDGLMIQVNICSPAVLYYCCMYLNINVMFQCDICMCWQHGICNHIETDEEVPDKYVCHICLNPARQRNSRKYAHDQDWLKEGTLPR
jgi:PHD finger protein 20